MMTFVRYNVPDNDDAVIKAKLRERTGKEVAIVHAGTADDVGPISADEVKSLRREIRRLGNRLLAEGAIPELSPIRRQIWYGSVDCVGKFWGVPKLTRSCCVSVGHPSGLTTQMASAIADVLRENWACWQVEIGLESKKCESFVISPELPIEEASIRAWRDRTNAEHFSDFDQQASELEIVLAAVEDYRLDAVEAPQVVRVFADEGTSCRVWTLATAEGKWVPDDVEMQRKIYPVTFVGAVGKFGEAGWDLKLTEWLVRMEPGADHIVLTDKDGCTVTAPIKR